MLYLALVFILLNLVALVFFDFNSFLTIRLISTVTAFCYLHIFIDYQKSWIYTIFGILIVSDISLFIFSSLAGYLIYISLLITTYIILTLKALKQVLWGNITLWHYLAYLGLFSFNLYGVYFTLNSNAQIIENVPLYYLISTASFIGLLTCFITACLNINRLVLKFQYLMYAAFGFVMSNFTAMLGYYFEDFTKYFYLADRGAYLFAIFFLLRYAYISSIENEHLENVPKKSIPDLKSP